MNREHIHECARDCGRCFVCPVDQCQGEWVCPICLQEEMDQWFSLRALEAEQQELAHADHR